jgi:hypothetical protein
MGKCSLRHPRAKISAATGFKRRLDKKKSAERVVQRC